MKGFFFFLGVAGMVFTGFMAGYTKRVEYVPFCIALLGLSALQWRDWKGTFDIKL